MTKQILVIEDQEEVRENIAELLELSGYDVIDASDGKKGIKLALDKQPDLILCDIMMPEMDGYEALYIMSKNPKTASIPFIFLTAKAEKSDFRKGMNLGADDYITKPFEEMELLGAVERRLERFEKISSEENLSEFISKANNYPGLESLEADLRVRDYGKRDIIYRQGDYANFAYKVLSGKVKIYQLNEDGKELIQHIAKEGEFFGEKALISDSDYSQFAQAMEDVRLQVIPRQVFNDLLHQNREVSGQFIKMLAQSLIEKEQTLVDMAYDTVRKRTANALIKLHETYGNDGEQSEFQISRADLASLVGTATESVIRILSEFKKDGILEIKGGTIKVLNVGELKAMPY